jgi:hypothetical protein
VKKDKCIILQPAPKGPLRQHSIEDKAYMGGEVSQEMVGGRMCVLNEGEDYERK